MRKKETFALCKRCGWCHREDGILFCRCNREGEVFAHPVLSVFGSAYCRRNRLIVPERPLPSELTSDEREYQRLHPRAVAVEMVTSDGDVTRFPSIEKAQNATGISTGSIRYGIETGNSVKGVKWRRFEKPAHSA